MELITKIQSIVLLVRSRPLVLTGTNIPFHRTPLFFILHFRCHAVNVCDNAKSFYDHLNNDLVTAGLDVGAEELLDIIEGYKGEGYAVSTDEERGECL